MPTVSSTPAETLASRHRFGHRLGSRRLHVAAGILVLVVTATAIVWWRNRPAPTAAGISSGNGRLEAVEINLSARTAGRVQEILVREGDPVRAGQVLARMDPALLAAELREAEAQRRQAASAVTSARSQVVLRRAEHAAAAALLAQREAERALARQRHDRSERLAESLANSRQEADEDQAREDGAAAAAAATGAQLSAAVAAIDAAEAAVLGAESASEAAAARVERVRAEQADLELRAPRDGIVQYLVAQAGETVAAGGRVLNLADLSEVHLTFFLPTAHAGRLAVGGEARLILDALPEFVFPAVVSFVSDVAQFTPKTVETAEEREKLMFRIRARLSPGLTSAQRRSIKAGLPGRAYVRTDETKDWPPALQVRLPP